MKAPFLKGDDIVLALAEATENGMGRCATGPRNARDDDPGSREEVGDGRWKGSHRGVILGVVRPTRS